MRHFTLFIVLVTVTAGPSFAWNRATHRITAAIAYSELKQRDPAALAETIRLLKTHPYFDDEWAEEIAKAPEPDRDIVLFMLASQWPDDVRTSRQYSQDKWHYINFPYKPASETANIRITGPDPDNIIIGFETSLNTLRSETPDSLKAVAVCWVLHLIGDSHQPLHTVKRITIDQKSGDRGGNDFYVQREVGNIAIPLHRVWDEVVSRTSVNRTIYSTAESIRRRVPRRSVQGELRACNMADWIQKESLPIAIASVYLNSELKGSFDHHDQVLLPADYLDKSKTVAERRVALAGYRIADTLSDLF